MAHLPKDWRDDIRGIKRFNFKQRQHPQTQMLIFFVDGKNFHGGLCDRFKGIVSMFHYCLCKNVSFKISYTYPFELSDYLLPNGYDWKLSVTDKVTLHFCETKHINLIGDASIRRLVRLNTNRQIHAYANRDIIAGLNEYYKANYQWGELFKKLFKPTKEMNEIIQYRKSKIGGEYIGAVFRFQNMLGDFSEYEYTPLPDEEKITLIEKCRCAVLELQQWETCKCILVTSDSTSFLKTLLKLNNIFVFPDKGIHIDMIAGAGHDTYMKSFLDFYLLSGGQKIYSIGTDVMYKSDFPLYAAKVSNIPFERILISSYKK
jgi:hypothetical protein